MYPYQLDMLLPLLNSTSSPYFMQTNIMPPIHHMPNRCFLTPLQSNYTKPIQITTILITFTKYKLYLTLTRYVFSLIFF